MPQTAFKIGNTIKLKVVKRNSAPVLVPRNLANLMSTITVALVFGGLLVAPEASLAQPQQSLLGLRSANAWMLNPTAVSVPSDVPRELKRRRDLYFDAIAATIGIRTPLTPEMGASLGITSEGSRIAGMPEIAAVPSRSIVIARFSASRSVLSESGKAIYTEITFHTTDVFEDASGRISPNSDITVSFLGGTVRTDAGKVISLLTNPRKYFLQPSRTYLLVLEYHAEQELYTVAGNWDLSSGIVTANSSADRELELRGRSRLLGLTKEQLYSYLSDYLKNQQ